MISLNGQQLIPHNYAKNFANLPEGNEYLTGEEFKFNEGDEWKPFTMKSREGVSRNILVQNQFKIKQSVLLYLLSASSV